MFDPNKAYIFKNEINTFYLSKFHASFAVILIYNNKKYYFTDSRYFDEAKNLINDFIVVETHSKDVNSKIASLLKDGISLGIEYDLPHNEFINTINYFKNYNYFDSLEEISKMRIIKGDYEINSIVSALMIAEKAFNKTISNIKEGVTEKDLAIELEYNMKKLGGEDKAFDTIVAFGEHSSIPHAKASNRQLMKGDVILFDFGTRVNGYLSDTTRTIAFGHNIAFERDYRTLLNINEELISLVKEDVLCSELNDRYAQLINTKFLNNEIKHSVGHGVGLEIHEEPFLNNSSNKILKSGMVVTIEPGIYKKNYGIRIEDMILVKKHDNIILSKFFNKGLIII